MSVAFSLSHLRASEQDAPSPQPAAEFAKKLRDHANEILSRVTRGQLLNLKLFEGGLEAASDGRFFVTVEADPTRYTLQDDGLTLALGFAVLDQLRTALRNDRDLNPTLEAIFEPVSALDQTARVILAAHTVACLDESYPVEVAAAVLCAFAEAQNPNAKDFDAFAALASERPEAFMRGVQRLCLAGGHQPNLDWIEAALHGARIDATAWQVISKDLESWLACYSLSAERGSFLRASGDSKEEVAKELAKKQASIDERLSSLSLEENELLSSMVKVDDGDLNTLTRFGLRLMTGKELVPFSRSVVKWVFGNALNPDHGSPVYKEFIHLVRFNRIDWLDARESMLADCRIFERPDVSPAGKWALLHILEATGDADDAACAETLYADLRSNCPPHGGWRLIEDYCASDPCDPDSVRPENISDTARKYAELDPSGIRLSGWSSAEDHFFSMARPGLARFEPDATVAKHREFIADVIGRAGSPLRYGLFELRSQNALFMRDDALTLVAPIGQTKKEPNEGGLTSDEWIVSQYRQLLAFPCLTPREQIEILRAQDPKDDILLDILAVAKTVDEGTFEAMLEKACGENDESSQYRILVFGGSTDTVISEDARRLLGSLTQSDSERIRAAAFRLIARLDDRQLLKTVAEGGWSAANLARQDGYEGRYGSAVILEAAAQGVISEDQALERIGSRFYAWAARKLGVEAVQDVAVRIDALIRIAVKQTIDPSVPDIEMHVGNGQSAMPTLYSASEKPSNSDDPSEAFRRFSESDEAFYERQRRTRDAFEAFKKKLTAQKAQIILDYLGIDEFDAIASSNRDLAESWYEMFVSLPPGRLMGVHNLGLLLAHALATWNPDKAVNLFAVLANSRPVVRVTFAHSIVSLDGGAIWSAAEHPTLDAVRFERLDRTANDHELAVEVLTALQNDKEALLRAYMERELATGESARISRALMVAGFSMRNDFNDDLLARYRDTKGFIGRARAAAMYAYERNVWAEHWFRKMCEAKEASEFWQHSILFTKIVDGRLTVWKTADWQHREPFQLFSESVRSTLKRRFKRWQDHRTKKLFGEDAPAIIFLNP